MANVADRNALRRLNTILKDEAYGPKLVRLGRADERRVLDLIERNRGAEARKLILKLDENRRNTASASRRVSKYLKLSPERRKKGYEYPENEERLFWAIYDNRVV